ncbi:MAG: ASKHA domain-containing protein [Paracoccaceae bacterium]|nr:ASKHA domain-containing protein [Paracoccaceae bacterium]
MADQFVITFQGEVVPGGGKSVAATTGKSVLDAARDAGLEVIATCGERGRCRSCRVKVLKGDAPPATIMDQVQLGHEEVQERFRLSCQMPVTGDATILIAPPKSEAGHKVLAIERREETGAVKLDSGVVKECVQVTLPDDENHQSSDVEELVRALSVEVEAPVPADILRKIPETVRARRNQVTVSLFRGEIIDVQPGDTSDQKLGMAFDVGTTSIVGSLLDLNTGQELASVGGVNPQSPFGGDLMSRIAYIQEDPKRLQTLRAKVLGAVNDYVKEACTLAKVDPQNIHKIAVVGNTCMHHIFLGINPTHVGLAPYAPSMRDPIVLKGSDIPLKTVPNARVCMLPIIAGFVGADTVAAALATRIYESDDMRCLVDIGTNGEVVMGQKGKLLACSAPAGPALEGGQIRHGMRGALGAIERVTIAKEVELQVIGGVDPIGICGSGLIDAVSAMLDAGILTQRGLIRFDDRETFSDTIRDRLRHVGERDEFVLGWAEAAGGEEDITLNQSDVRQLQLAKGAICSGVLLLERVLDIANEEIREIYLCGGFGNYINTESALRIRLLPDVGVERVTYFGNAAGMGAQMALLSETERARANDLAREIEHVAMATHPEFQDVFLDALEFPAAPNADSEATGSRVA